MVAEVTCAKKFLDGIPNFKNDNTTQPPKRPTLVLLSGILEQKPRNPIGEWLVLDEAHAIKNSDSRTYHAISALRQHFKACLLMTRAADLLGDADVEADVAKRVSALCADFPVYR